MSRNYAMVNDRRTTIASLSNVDFNSQNSRTRSGWSRKNSVANSNFAQTADQKHAKTCGTITRVVGGVLGGLFALSLVAVFVVPYTLSEIAKVNKSYQETCGYDFKCNQSQLLECPTVNGGCNCPVYSTTKKCDCKIGYFWDYDKKTCTKRKAYGEVCINQTDYQCALNTTLICTGTCSCPNSTWDYWEDGKGCTAKKALWSSCLVGGPSDQCISIYTCDSTGICGCPNTHYKSGTVCLLKKLYQVTCASNSECDDNKNLECPVNAGLCNCPTLSSANKCDCLVDYYWDSALQTCVPRRQYGESCTNGSDYQCVANKNFLCDGTCTCPLVLRWTGSACDLDLERFFTYVSNRMATSTCGNITIGNGRSIEPKNAINYVMDVTNNQVVLFDADWNCNSVKPVTLPRFMKVVENDIYISTDLGLKKMDSNFNTLITLNSSSNYRRLTHDKDRDYIIANGYVMGTIDTYDRNLTMIDSFNLRAYGYFQSASGVFWHQGTWYVGTDRNQVLIIRNNTIESVYHNVCLTNTSVNTCVDNYGNMAIACTGDRRLMLYGVDGVYKNLYINTTSAPNYLGYDSKGRIVATGGGSIDIFS